MSGVIPPRRSRGLLARIFGAHLVVIAVAASSALFAGWAFAPLLLERHLETMGHRGMPPLGFERMAADLEEAYRRALMQSVGWAAALATLVAGGVAWGIATRLVTPLRQLERASAAIAAGRRSGELDLTAPGELGALATSFQTMARALDEADEVRAQLVTDLAHELRTPLSNLRGYLEGLEDGVFDLDPLTRTALMRQVERLERLVNDLRVLHDAEADPAAMVMAPFDVAQLARSSVAAFAARYAEKRVALELAVDDAPIALGDGLRSAQVIENLLDNALRHTPSGGSVEVEVRDAGHAIAVSVSDSGPGIGAHEREAIFRRLYRGDPARTQAGGGGSGVGLTIAKALVERQAGEIEVGLAAAGGARFTFTLPRG
jgi:two-component system, OmpR family, sensor histidine kinase BaeS